jgi:hypothetical protein
MRGRWVRFPCLSSSHLFLLSILLTAQWAGMVRIAFLMDAAPQLSDLGLPFRAGLDDLVRPSSFSSSPVHHLSDTCRHSYSSLRIQISLVPLYGDALSALLSLYGVVLGTFHPLLRSLLYLSLLPSITYPSISLP